MIPRNLILKHAPERIGQQIHINHVGCPAGEDHKRRLYIKRTSTGIIAYCHHCTEHGVAEDAHSRFGHWLKSDEKSLVVPSPSFSVKTAPISIQGKMWLGSYHCNYLDENFSGVEHRPDSVALKLHNSQQEPIGWQVRNLIKGAPQKYLTSYTDTTNHGESSWFYKNNNMLVITEDYLSAYRVARDTLFSSVALLRTSITDKTLLQIHDLKFEMIFIWLDPDDAGIKGAIKAQHQLLHFLSNTKIAIYATDKEPKQCSPKELREHLI